MKKHLLFLVLLFAIKGFSQNIAVTPAPSGNTGLNQWVNNLLVNNSCLAQTASATKTGFDTYGGGASIGSFTNTNPNFPIASGVVMSSGTVASAQGPNLSGTGTESATWLGDADANAALGITSINASVLEFDFTAATTSLSISYLFASQEYGRFQCTSKDGVAILLSRNGGPYVNIAKTASNEIISVETIRSRANNNNCGDANANLFGQFNGGGSAAASAINFEGQTVLMTATSTLVAGDSYHIKIVVVDDGNANNNAAGTESRYDSAVFFPAGSFNLGQLVVGEDLTLAGRDALCVGESRVINTGLSATAYGLSWTRNGQPTAGGASITITQAGTYVLTIVNNASGCTTTEQIVVEYAPPFIPGTPANLYACDTGAGTYTYNLAQNTPVIKQGLDPLTQVTYHASLNNANQNLSPLPASYTAAPNQTIYARVKSHNSSCVVIVQFDILTTPAPVANQPATYTLCEGAQASGTATFNLTSQNPTILGSQAAANYSVFFYTSQADANANTANITTPGAYVSGNRTIYVRVQSNFNTACFSTTSFNIAVTPLPVLAPVADVTTCSAYPLPALTVGNYYTGNGGTGTRLNAGDLISSTQTIYVYALSGTCSNQTSFVVNVLTTVTTPANVTACTSYTLPSLPDGQQYRTAANGGGTVIPGGTVLTATTTVFFYIPTAQQCTNNSSFTVTIIGSANPGNQNVCGASYTLPARTDGARYFTAAGGPAGTGTAIAAGTALTTSQTVYVYNSNPSNPACTSESSFVVNINNTVVAPVSNSIVCGSYPLPVLTIGNYYSQPNGVGLIPAGTTISTTQTIYVYAVSATDPTCSSQVSFTITVNPLPDLAYIDPVTACRSYTLPVLPNGATYFTGTNGTGTALGTSAVITTSQTIYALTPPNASNCRRQRQFVVTILGNPLVLQNQTACESYTLPAPAAGNYYALAGGPSAPGNTRIPAGTIITSTRTIHVYAVSPTDATCISQGSFTVTINPLPTFDPIPYVVVCGSYTVPARAGITYYTETDGGGTVIPANTVLTQGGTIFARAVNASNCAFQRSFRVDIINPNTSIAPADVTACTSYTLPARTLGNYYEGPNGTGTQRAAGYVVTTSRPMYVYAVTTEGTNCTGDDRFDITIVSPVTADAPANVQACNSYTLPALTNGSYFRSPNGVGPIAVGTVLTTSQDVYVYNANAGCNVDNRFTVTINQISVPNMADVTVCAETGYLLPALAAGNYYTGPGGPIAGNTQIPAGTIIRTSQTIYVYAQITGTTPLCSAEDSFIVTISPSPVVDDLGTAAGCGSYTLPTLSPGNRYFTGTGGTGTELFAGQVITTTQTIYIFVRNTAAPFCTAQSDFEILIDPQAPVDVVNCDFYNLPALPAGQFYYTNAGGPGAGNTQLPAGTRISATQRVYFYIPAAAACTQNTFFTVTIFNTPVLEAVPSPAPVVCDEYFLPAISVGNYYTAAGGPAGGGRVLDPSVPLTTSQTVYVYAENGTCSAENSFAVNITQTPLTDARSGGDFCRSYLLDPLTVGTYYALSGGPTAPGQRPLTGSITTLGQTTIYIYAEAAANPSCFKETSFTVNIFDIDADTIIPAGETQIESCDSYTLPTINEGDTEYSQHYYTLPGGPDVPGQVRLNIGDVITATTDVYIWAQLEGRVACDDQTTNHIEIYTTPQIPVVQDEIVCDRYEVPLPPALVQPIATGLTYEYYTAAGGPNGTGQLIPVGTPYTAPANTTVTYPIFLYAYTGNGLCFDEEDYTVTINNITVPIMRDVTACESYTLPPLAVGNYFTATNGGGTPYFAGDVITSTTPMHIYGVTTTTPPCSNESSFQITIVPRPVGIIPAPVHACATDDSNQFGIFDLNAALAEALGTQLNVTVSVHETPEDAQFNEEPITDLTRYLSNVPFRQQLYIRLSSTLADCYTIVNLQLIVDPRPVAAEPALPYGVCDNGISDTDGIGVFDLTSYETQILNGLNPLQFGVSYFATQADADANTPQIQNPATYESTGGSVFIKVYNLATGCDDIVELELVVNPMPVAVRPVRYELCDETEVGGVPVQDETEVFDLTTKINEITGGASGVVVTFYNTNLQDAQAGLAAGQITTPTAYSNTTATESVFVRVTDAVSGCYRIVILDIKVNPLPIIVEPTPADLTMCDTDGNGYANFDLDALVDDMVNNDPNVVVHFYATLIGAQNNLPNSIINNTSDYINQNPFVQQHIWVRAENTVTGCLSRVYELVLTIVPAPQVPDLAPLRDCDDAPNQDNQDNQAEFDLTVRNTDILAAPGITNPSALLIRYFNTEQAAIDGTPMIIRPEQFTATNGQIVWVRIEYPGEGCYSITSLVLQIDTPVDVVDPTMLIACDIELPNNPSNNQSFVFDLTVKDVEILGPTGQGQDNTVTYYLNDADADAGIPVPDALNFTNTVNPQTLTVVVRTIFGCESRTTLTVKVQPLPTPNPTPDPLVLCDDNNAGDLEEEFDLTDAENNILLNSALSTLTYYTNQADAELGFVAPALPPAGYIADPEHYVSATGSVWVRAELAGSEPGSPVCWQVVELPLVVNPLPATTAPTYGICQTVFTGTATFDLGNYRNIILGPGVNLADYTVRYYPQDPRVVPPGSANNNATLPFLYPNATNPQTIWVYAQNNTTLCDVVLPLILSVEPQTIANPVPADTLRECDYDGVNDGIFEIDLTEATPFIIGTQSPAANYLVTYYLNEIDARADQNAIPNPAAFATATTTIWAMIKNTGYPYGCPAYIEIPVTIDLLPVPVLSADDDRHTSCVDFESGVVLREVVIRSNITEAGSTFQWFKDGVAIPGATDDFYAAVDTGLYTVTVYGPAPGNCESDPAAGWQVTKSGPASLIDDGYVVSNAFADDQTITILVEGFGNYQYSMYQDGPWQNSNVFTNVTVGYHDIYVRDITNGADACDPIVINDVSTIDYPKYFTPNGDGYNDYWNIIGLANFPSSRIYIFDRYGKLIKQLSPTSNPAESEGWDGTFNGAPLPSDDYWFTVTFPEGDKVREFKSHFAMKR